MREKRWLSAILCIMLAALIAGCEQPAPAPSAEPSAPQCPGAGIQETLPAPETELWMEEDGDISAWAAYWDTKNVIAELEEYKHLEALCYFEAYFNSSEELILPEEILTLQKTIGRRFPNAGWTSYLTFVNDQVDEAGQFSLKDTELLWTLLGTEASMLAHVEDVIALAKAWGFGGVEIDYESIRKDMLLWEKFLAFCRALYARTGEEGLALRVLLEPGAPFENLAFPNGPTYVMMCYNLHGGHSGPGPKADAAFIRELVQKMRMLPGRKDFAIATGGFDWSEGEVRQVTEIGAESLAAEYEILEAWRDAASQSRVFRYADEAGKGHEVWYADQTTLHYWTGILRAEGCDGISIWRLGGNRNAVKQ